ncbi:hypothetical protein E2R68_08385 [Psychromonas sp. RZ22]|uniref:hypothetical protein n=1 Tax=Psychromonas algarum TaxID=2555643 RepID=UPI00106739C0|nr:hypothetical protein [Psychromonas sp. RZ22]TEW54707.1 hypothetical protein E2R68_08385 [Psychromonas sp. RZ22]
MKKIYLGLAIAGLLTGCVTTDPTAAKPQKSPTDNQIFDAQLTQFRNNSGNSDVWHKDADRINGLGDIGSSKDTAFDDEGSARIRFVAATDDFTAEPGLTQEIQGLEANTDYEFSLYYSDKKGPESITDLVFGATTDSGQSLAKKSVHASELIEAPMGAVKTAFRQTSVSFNTGANTSVKVFAKIHISDPSKIDKNGDIGKQTEVRVDEFKLIKK